MTRLGRSLTAFAILAGVFISGDPLARQAPSGVRAAGRTGLVVQPTLLVPSVGTGERAALFVHAPAFTQLRLVVTYPGGASSRYKGTADGHGRYVFSWTVPATLRHAGSARLQLLAKRGSQIGSWSGELAVRRAPPPLFVRPIATHVLAGTRVALFVGTAPGTPFSYRLVAQGGVLIAQGAAKADARGRRVLSVPERYLPHRAAAVLATIAVAGPEGSRTATARLTLLPRPPLPLVVAVAQKAVHAGMPLTIRVESEPGTLVSLRVLLGAEVLARGSGITDAAGRWTFTTALATPISRAVAARVAVQASHGIDRISGRATFLLQPGSPGIVDHLATASNPTPDLLRLFTTIPDKVIMISAATGGQTLRAYDHGVLVHEDYVTTGRPELPTPPGIYRVMAKYAPYEMVSPWPAGSPFYYPPSWTHFAMLFRDGGYFLHDAPWRAVYGPGTNLPHASDPGEPVGTHGCVNLPYPDMVWLWNWASVGTTVVVY